MVGCCIHVATVINYLSNAKYQKLSQPAEYLNSIFVDLNKKEAANQPRYVRNKRSFKKPNEPNSDISGDDTDFDDTKNTLDFVELTDSEKEDQQIKTQSSSFTIYEFKNCFLQK
jgi:hypothetical protein